jgi:hypothetical protein
MCSYRSLSVSLSVLTLPPALSAQSRAELGNDLQLLNINSAITERQRGQKLLVEENKLGFSFS